MVNKSIIGATCACAFMLITTTSHAALIDNGGSTIDSDTGLEWLDLTATVGQGYNDIIGGFGGYAAAGYVHATTSQLCTLWSNAGAGLPGCTSSTEKLTGSISQASADHITGLFGDTTISNDIFSSLGIFDGGQIGSGFIGLGCIEAGERGACSLGPPFAERDLQWAYLTDSSGNAGNWLVRDAVVPIPSAVWLFGSGLLGLIGFARRKANA